VRLRSGDSDLTPDELEGALANAEEKRRSLWNAPSVAGVSRAIAMLPSRGRLQQIKQGLAADMSASGRAAWRCGSFLVKIKMLPERAGSLI